MKSFLILLAIVVVQCYEDLFEIYKNGNQNFSANVYKEMLKTNSGNFLFCPMSVETVFAIINQGAKDKTLSQITTAFNFPPDNTKIQQIYTELSPSFQHTGHYNLSSANKLYINRQFKINDNFKNVVTKVFNGEIQEINFADKENAVNEINHWVEEKTFNKINDILSKNDISEFTKLVLVNAMYFKGKWQNEFSEKNTKKSTFYLNPKDTIDVDMMETTKSFSFHECAETKSKYLKMNFLYSYMTMTIILPDEKDGLTQLENQLDKVLEEPEYEHVKVHVRLPKFETGSSIKFKPILQELGVVDAFEPTADFTGISANPYDRLSIDKVIQKTYIKVEEKGTTAAAATAVTIALTSLPIARPKPPKEFYADHPFIYVIKNSYGIMFVGRFVSNKN